MPRLLSTPFGDILHKGAKGIHNGGELYQV